MVNGRLPSATRRRDREVFGGFWRPHQHRRSAIESNFCQSRSFKFSEKSRLIRVEIGQKLERITNRTFKAAC